MKSFTQLAVLVTIAISSFSQTHALTNDALLPNLQVGASAEIGVSLLMSGSALFVQKATVAATTSLSTTSKPVAPVVPLSVNPPKVQISSSTSATSKTTPQFTPVKPTQMTITTPSATANIQKIPQTTTPPATPTTTLPQAASSALAGFYVGANSYYIYALQDADRQSVLDAMKSAGMSVLRIFVTHIYQNNKGSGNDEIPDVEPVTLGVYDDTILRKIDVLMSECAQRGIKLIISMGDRYALGWWDTDAYATTFGVAAPGTTGAQVITDASAFYSTWQAKDAFDKRIDHILSHKNSLMGNKKWSELDSVVYAFEPQNEAMGHMDQTDSWWVCDRAGRIKQNLPKGSGIKVANGGGISMDTSLADWAWNCGNFDIIAVHDYNTDAAATAATLAGARTRAAASGKVILFEEFGAIGAGKAGTLKWMAQQMKAAQIPWLVWQIVQPGAAANDFEIWTDEDTWSVFADTKLTGATNISKRDLQAVQPNIRQIPISQAVAPALSNLPTAAKRFEKQRRLRRAPFEAIAAMHQS